jgi:hypothetical protein
MALPFNQGGRMAWRSIRPVRGWDDLAQEVLIVVAGVLIALGAQKIVDDWRWRGEIKEFRAALDNELGYDLAAYQDRLSQNDCVARRLDQLDRWLAETAAGPKRRLLTPIGRPVSLATRTSVWDSRTSDAASHLGLKVRLAYAKFYDSVAVFSNVRASEREVWSELSEFEGAEELDAHDRMRLRGLIERARFLNGIVRFNWKTYHQRMTAFGIRPWRESDEPARANQLCQPLRWRAP